MLTDQSTRQLARYFWVLHFAIKTHAPRMCYAFMTEMHNALPQELRDVIYGHLLRGPPLAHINRQVHSLVEHYCCAFDRALCSPQFDLPRFLEFERIHFLWAGLFSRRYGGGFGVL